MSKITPEYMELAEGFGDAVRSLIEATKLRGASEQDIIIWLLRICEIHIEKINDA
jgi:hypothetical protein